MSEAGMSGAGLTERRDDDVVIIELHGSVLGESEAPRVRSVYVGRALVDAAWAVREAWGLAFDSIVAVDADGRAVDQDAPLCGGDRLHIAPMPGDLSTGIMIAIAIASAAASAVMAGSVRLPPAQGSEDGQEQRYGFGRFSNRAFSGDVVPVVYGEIARHGGKVIAVVPSESSDGSGEERIRMLIALSLGAPYGIAAIGNQTADFDNVPAANLADVYLRDQEIAGFAACRAWGRMGTSDQRAIPGFDDIELMRDVGVGGANLRNTSGGDRTGVDASGEAVAIATQGTVNAVVVRVRLEEGLYRVASSAQVESHTVRYRVRWQPLDDAGNPVDGYGAWQTISLTQANQAGFWSSPRLEIGSLARRVRVQAERVSAEPTDVATRDSLNWASIIEVRDSEETYPGVALLALELVAGEQLQSVPEVSVRVKGRKVRVHDGVSPPTAMVFTPAYSNNNADCLLDYATNAEFGMGLDDTQVNFSQLLALRARCNELVERRTRPGEFAPRHTFNYVFAQQREHMDNLITIAQAARAMPSMPGQTLGIVMQVPQSVPVETYTDGSIARDGDGQLQLTTTIEWTQGGLTRPNQVMLQYEADAAEGDVDDVVYPEDGELWLADESPEQSQERLDGVTDVDELYRHSVYKMNSLRFVAEAVELEPTHAFPRVRPGERFDLATSMLGYAAASGRVRLNSTTSQVRLDREVVLASLPAGQSYRLRVYHLDGSVETQLVTSPPGAYGIGQGLSLAAPLAQAPAEGAEYALEIPQRVVVAKPFICTSVSFSDENGDIRWRVAGTEYVEGVFADVGGDVSPPRYSSLGSPSTPPGPVIGLRIFDRQNPTTGVREAHLAWGQQPEDAAITASYHLYRRIMGTAAWVRMANAVVTRRAAVVEIADTTRGYEFVVVAVSATGAYLSADDVRHPKATLVLGGAVLPPPAPAGLAIASVGGNTYDLAWTAVDGAVAYVVMAGGVPGGGNAGDKVFANACDCRVLARVASNALTGLRLPLASHGPGGAPTAGQVSFYVRSVGANGRMSEGVSRVDVGNALAPTGMAAKHGYAADLSTGWTNAQSLASTPGTGVDWVPTTVGTAAVWEGPIVDTGSDVPTQLVYHLRTVNRAADPTIAATPFVVPSIEADQWGVDAIDAGGERRAGMIFPPFTAGAGVHNGDATHRWVVEVAIEVGGVWQPYVQLAAFASLAGTFRRYRVRVSMSSGAAPYRPGVRALAVSTFA